jgi:hypothetical protein
MVPPAFVRDMTAAGLANATSSAILNPSDVTKVRLQSPGGDALYGGLRGCVAAIVEKEGVAALWTTGLTSSMIREAVYSSTRMGMYPYVKSALGTRDDDLGSKVLAGAFTGTIASVFGNPIDVVKVTIMAEAGALGPDGKFTSGLRAGHAPTWPGTFAGLWSVLFRERTFLRGFAPSVMRGALMASSQLASYDQSKVLLKRHLGYVEGTQVRSRARTPYTCPTPTESGESLHDASRPSHRALAYACRLHSCT